MLLRFGGHAAAAGVTIRATEIERFRDAFEVCARRMLDPLALERVIETDGQLEPQYHSHPIARMLATEVWGQGFPAPLFVDEFEVISQKLVAERHSKLKLRRGAHTFDAIAFNRTEPVPARVRAVYRLDLNEWNGLESVQLTIEHLVAVATAT